MDNKTNSKYDMILGRELLIALGLYLFFSENIIIGGEGPYEGCSAPMVDLSKHNFKYLTENIVKPEEYFINLYIYECLESKSSIISTRRMCIVLGAKYKKADINKVMTD